MFSGFHDVIPGFESNRANPNQPKFENFTQTLYRAGHWAFMQQVNNAHAKQHRHIITVRVFKLLKCACCYLTSN